MDKDSELKALGDKIKIIRKEKGITQVELAARVNKDQQSIQRLESGRINPSYFYLKEISKGLGVSIKFLVYDGDS